MLTRDVLQSHTAPPLGLGGATPSAAGTPPSALGSGAFSTALRQARSGAPTPPGAGLPTTPPSGASTSPHIVAGGETLIGIVRKQAQSIGIKLAGPEESRLAQELASANRVSNADRIYVGQNIELSGLQAQLQAMQTANTPPANPAAQAVLAPSGKPLSGSIPRSTPLAYDVRSHNFTPAANKMAQTTGPRLANSGAHPVLEKTLDRAVAKGFIPAAEKTAVYDKILQMASNHRFSPDDFARMTLMESDGMNPRASNQRCHGIIQFCDGPARGAASAGYGANPKAILDLSVHQQLSLVDRYFDDVGLKSQGPAGLEDLYLSVLNPASRAQAQSNTPLNIQGQQASALHVGSDTAAPITRQSIRHGLLENAKARLGQMLPTGLRLGAQRAQQYVENAAP